MAIHFGPICVTLICGLLVMGLVSSEDLESSLGNGYDLCDDSNIPPVLRSRLCGTYFDKMPTESNLHNINNINNNINNNQYL